MAGETGYAPKVAVCVAAFFVLGAVSVTALRRGSVLSEPYARAEAIRKGNAGLESEALAAEKLAQDLEVRADELATERGKEREARKHDWTYRDQGKLLIPVESRAKPNPMPAAPAPRSAR